MSEEDKYGNDHIINLSSKKTEDEWAISAHSFFEKTADIWFKWLGWIFATGGVAYLANKTNSITLRGIQAISYAILYCYFLYFFASIKIEPYHSWAISQKTKRKRFIALLPIIIFLFVILLGFQILIKHLIYQIQQGK